MAFTFGAYFGTLIVSMYPENQNTTQGGNESMSPQGQQSLNTGMLPGQQPVQTYGLQQYSPMSVNGQIPGQVPPKNNKKLVGAIAVLMVMLFTTIAVAVFMNLQKSNNPVGQEMTQAYSSPVGLTAGMQAKGVKSGKFKLRANYVSGGEFIREGTFTVEDGHLYFRMIPDAERVNELMKTLYDHQGKEVNFDAEKDGVSNYISYDFADMLGYHYLYDQHGGEFSGFVPAVEAAKSSPRPDKRYTLTTACDSALAAVKKQTDMNTVGLKLEIQSLGINKKEAKVSFTTLREVDKSVTTFFDNCFDLDLPAVASLKQFVDKRKQDVTKSPTFTFWNEGGANYLDVSAPTEDTPFGGELHFELTSLSSSPSSDVGKGGSYVERRNQFGLTYSLCRVDPVITRAESYGYRFLREDPAYEYPNILDTGYYCSTLDVPPQFSPPSTITLPSTTGVSVPIVGGSIHGLRGLHDLVNKIEDYNISNERYPGPIEFRDMASGNMDSLTDVTKAAFVAKSLVYSPLPLECVGTCNDYALSFVPARNVQVQRDTYKP